MTIAFFPEYHPLITSLYHPILSALKGKRIFGGRKVMSSEKPT